MTVRPMGLFRESSDRTSDRLTYADVLRICRRFHRGQIDVDSFVALLEGAEIDQLDWALQRIQLDFRMGLRVIMTCMVAMALLAIVGGPGTSPIGLVGMWLAIGVQLLWMFREHRRLRRSCQLLRESLGDEELGDESGS